MVIDRVYGLVRAISNKEQRGDIPPAQFNLLAEMAQLEYMSKRLGPIKIINNQGVSAVGYESTWRIHEDLRPMVSPPAIFPLDPVTGNFAYPYGYIWPDAIRKTDGRDIRRITEDQYARIKHSQIVPPAANYPVVIMRGQYGFVDPYNIGSIVMSYLKTPPIPVWGSSIVNDVPVFDANISVDFSVPPLAYIELTQIILAHVGINLGDMAVTQFAKAQEMS